MPCKSNGNGGEQINLMGINLRQSKLTSMDSPRIIAFERN